MTISSSLSAGVAGLNANAVRLAAISDNISNSATLGYKRAEVDFHAMVVGSGNSARYIAGGVTTTNQRLIDQSGALTQTNNVTDISISGRGFLPVTKLSALPESGSPLSFGLRTTGSFRANSDGYLVNATGQVLLGWPADATGNIPTQPRETISALRPVQVNMAALAANPTTNAAISLNLPATDTAAGGSGQPYEMTMEYYNPLGEAGWMTYRFTPIIPATGSSNQWIMEIEDSISASTLGSWTLDFATLGPAAGMLQSATPVGASPAYDAATGQIGLTLPHGPVTLSIGKPGEPGGLSQLAAGFVPTAPVKDGSPVSSVVALELDEQGNLYGVYDRGFSKLLYQIPVADVRNPNGLISLGDQTYQVSSTSGSFYLWDAGTGPAGVTRSFTREESSTDVAHELTQLIQTQRAYSSNAKVIQTVDEMLQETTNLKR